MNFCPQCEGPCCPEEMDGLCPRCLLRMLARLEEEETLRGAGESSEPPGSGAALWELLGALAISPDLAPSRTLKLPQQFIPNPDRRGETNSRYEPRL